MYSITPSLQLTYAHVVLIEVDLALIPALQPVLLGQGGALNPHKPTTMGQLTTHWSPTALT